MPYRPYWAALHYLAPSPSCAVPQKQVDHLAAPAPAHPRRATAHRRHPKPVPAVLVLRGRPAIGHRNGRSLDCADGLQPLPAPQLLRPAACARHHLQELLRLVYVYLLAEALVLLVVAEVLVLLRADDEQTTSRRRVA